MNDKPRTRGKGRKPVLVLVHLRIPADVRDYYREFPQPTVKMREVLVDAVPAQE